MIKLFSLSIIFLMVMSACGKPQLPQTTPTIPSYVILPQIPNNFTPPPPGQPSSFSINQIRNRRASANKTAFSSPSASFSSSRSSSEENQSKTHKKSPNGSTTFRKPEQHDEPKLLDSGRAKIEAYSAPLAQLDLPGMMPPVTHRMLINESNADGLLVFTTPGTTTVATTIPTTMTSGDIKETTLGNGH
ncbi:unnamed protein product [Chironomus riparius]|uniref:Uncharacterized protein n=1 Tax=Chironomus riparius TaxID=315576 RepID=A0A9N9SAL0_9DIPT|nr:unnamed protein product [Chironomus riparius]